MNVNVLTTALRIAAKAHAGQVDRAGKPYIFHPLHVAMNTGSFDEVVVALLHDVMEDYTYTAEDLRAEGIPEHILEALALLTHSKEEPYMDYVMKIKGNELARAVKLADLAHNSDLSRLPSVTEKDLQRVEKYKQAMAALRG